MESIKFESLKELFIYACSSGNLELVELLTPIVKKYKSSLKHMQHRYINIVKYLISSMTSQPSQRGPDISRLVKNGRGDTHTPIPDYVR